MSKLRTISLFSGIGGLDLGLTNTGHFDVVAHSEIDPYACKVLKNNFPDVPNLGDITKVSFLTLEQTLGKVDVIAGGFPCQSVSVGNKSYTKISDTSEKSGLWSEFARAIKELQPNYVIIENVRGLTKRGLDTVLSDLASLGYDAIWTCVPAAAVGAGHIRWRLFILAYSNSERFQEQWRKSPTYAKYPTIERGGAIYRSLGLSIADRAEAYSDLWKAEPGVGRMADGISSRVDRLKCLGNAVVPQVAETIGYALKNHENLV